MGAQNNEKECSNKEYGEDNKCGEDDADEGLNSKSKISKSEIKKNTKSNRKKKVILMLRNPLLE